MRRSRLYLWGSTMIDVQFILGGLFTALVLGYAVGKQFLVFRQITDSIT